MYPNPPNATMRASDPPFRQSIGEKYFTIAGT